MQSAQLEQKLENLVSAPQTPQIPNFVNPQTGMYTQQQQNLGWGMAHPYSQIQFAEPNSQNQFAGPFGLRVEGGNLIVMVLGAILAGSIGGIINRFFPIGGFAPIIGGIILRMILKTGKGRDFANGVLIGGAASAFSGIFGNLLGGIGGGGLFGGLFGERKTSAPSRISQPGMERVRF